MNFIYLISGCHHCWSSCHYYSCPRLPATTRCRFTENGKFCGCIELYLCFCLCLCFWFLGFLGRNKDSIYTLSLWYEIWRVRISNLLIFRDLWTEASENVYLQTDAKLNIFWSDWFIEKKITNMICFIYVQVLLWSCFLSNFSRSGMLRLALHENIGCTTKIQLLIMCYKSCYFYNWRSMSHLKLILLLRRLKMW